jgi:hypothetical protein
MSNPRKFTIPKVTYSLVAALFAIVLITSPKCLCADQTKSGEMLSQIMDLHKDLVTNEMFLDQAKMLGVYLEAAQPLEEAKKVEIYSKVLDILTKIKNSGSQSPIKPPKDEGQPEQKTYEGEQKGKNVFVPGSAVLEIFKADSIETIPKLPVIRTYWERDLAYDGDFLIPDREPEIGRGSHYVAKFSFYYEAKQPGKYGFTIIHNRVNSCVLTIGGVQIANTAGKEVGQGVCTLEKGFHRVEFWLSSVTRYAYQKPASFQVKCLAPDSFDGILITKDMMLLKKE